MDPDRDGMRDAVASSSLDSWLNSQSTGSISRMKVCVHRSPGTVANPSDQRTLVGIGDELERRESTQKFLCRFLSQARDRSERDKDLCSRIASK